MFEIQVCTVSVDEYNELRAAKAQLARYQDAVDGVFIYDTEYKAQLIEYEETEEGKLKQEYYTMGWNNCIYFLRKTLDKPTSNRS